MMQQQEQQEAEYNLPGDYNNNVCHNVYLIFSQIWIDIKYYFLYDFRDKYNHQQIHQIHHELHQIHRDMDQIVQNYQQPHPFDIHQQDLVVLMKLVNH